MKSKTLFPLLTLLFAALLLAACGGTQGPTVTEGTPQDAYPGQAGEPAGQGVETPAAAAGDRAAEAYPPARPPVVVPPTAAYPASPVEAPSTAGEPYPPPQTALGGTGAAAYPAPYPAPYPGPESAAAESAAEEPQTAGTEPAPGDAGLTNRVWIFDQFSGADGAAVLPSADVTEINTIEFFADGRVSVIAGCNTAKGVYSAGGGQIAIDSVQRTANNCDRASLGSQFLGWLNESAVYSIEGETLSLALPENGGRMQMHGSELLTYGDQLTKALTFVAGLGVADAQPQTMEELLDASLDKLVYQEGDEVNLAFGQAPGAVVLVESPAGSMVKAAGLSNLEAGTPMSAFDRLQIGSNTKMFTAALLAQLQEEGVLSLDDPLSRWLPDMAAKVPNGEAITLRHLATHTSGLPDYGDAVIGAGAGDSEALRSGYTPEELVLLAVESSPPDFAPGEPNRFQYSNTGYILLGMVLEAATGQTYRDLLQTRIFEPLGMNDSDLQVSTPVEGSITEGYFVFPFDNNTTEWNASQAWAAGGIVSTAADMAKFARGLMSGALFQDPATQHAMTSFIQVDENAQVGDIGGLGYGLGLIEFAPGLWGHRGQTIGFSSIVAMDPAEDFLFIALTNSAEAAVRDEQAYMGHFLQLDNN